jgi:hypothetical protein
MLIRVGIHQLANAFGLIVATAVLSEMTITALLSSWRYLSSPWVKWLLIRS